MGSAVSKLVVDIKQIEQKLIQKLKRICKNGREVDQLKSASILHQLGKVYHLQGKRDSDPICLIQSAGLYNAALVRSPNNQRKITQDLKQLCEFILSNARAKNQRADLIKHANIIKSQFKLLREQVKQQLRLIPRISESASESETNKMEQDKVNLVRNLQTHITQSYTEIMADLAKYCHDVMGNAPCKFAIIGMGSIARKEITPYSDFEHVIALEDTSSRNYTQQELNYFRWFSVIFQLVVVNLKETILPSLAIPSLNDFYGEANGENWFFDCITPRGVSFDGMMPHACKFPVGCQKPTKNKPWKTELIKPVTEMLDYLTEESRLKEGYHLNDILTKTCFIYGDETIFNTFHNEVIRSMNEQTSADRTESITKQIKVDLENFATRTTLFQIYMQQDINIKKVAYRSSTLFITAMGRISNINEFSCFEVIEKLAGQKEISSYAKQQQMYAVAVACEIRLRWYMECNSQTDYVKSGINSQSAVETLFDIVGKPSTKRYFQIAYALQCDISKRLGLKKILFHSNPQLLNLSISICTMDLSAKQSKNLEHLEIKQTKFDRLYKFDECLQILLKENSSNRHPTNKNEDRLESATFFNVLLEVGDFLYWSKCYGDALEYYQKCLQTKTDVKGNSIDILNASLQQIDQLCKTNVELIREVVNPCTLLGDCLAKTNRANEGVKYLRLSATFQEKLSSKPQTDVKLSRIYHRLGQSLLVMRNFSDARTYFESSLQIDERVSNDPETDTSLASTLHELGQCLLDMNQCNEALKYFERALQIDERATNDPETDTSLARTLHSLGRCLQDMNQCNEAVKYFERALQIKERATNDPETDTSLASTLHELGQCLLDMNQCKQAVKYFERALQINERATNDPETDTSLASTLHSLGRCLLDMNQCNEAVKYFERALQIVERATNDPETDTSLAITLHLLGQCLLGMNQCNEAVKYFERALQVVERATNDPETDTSLARTLHSLGRCLLDMNQCKEAVKYFERVLQIDERATNNPETDTSLASTLHSLGRCLLDMNQCNEALKYFERALQIQERATNDPETDTSLASTLHLLGRCLQDMNQCKEAVKYFERALQIKERATNDPETDTSLAITLHSFGRCLQDMNQCNEAVTYFERVLQIVERATNDPETDTSLASTLHSLGWCLLDMNQCNEAVKYFERALQIDERVSNDPETDTSLAIILHELGQCLQDMNQCNEAVTYFERALQIKERATNDPETDTSLASTLHSLGRCLLDVNQSKEALKYFERALQIVERATNDPETDTSLAITLHLFGRCLLDMNQCKEAVKYFERALQIQERATSDPETDTSLASTLHSLGRCLQDMNQCKEAVKYFERALQIDKRATNDPETDTSLASTLHSLGQCLLGMNQCNEAVTYFERALQIVERATNDPETDTSLASTLHELSSVC